VATLDQVLRLLITADGRGLSAGLQRATGEIRGFGAAAQRTFGTVQSAFAALGVTIGTGAFVVGIKRIIDGFDQLNDSSKRLGVSTEALSGLAFAAEQSGTSLEGLQTGLRFLNRNLIEAQDGSKDLAQAFRELGVSLTDDTETALLKISDAFAKLPDGAQKTAFAMKVFGRSGAELIPLLNEGAAGIARFRDEAERMGLIVSKQSAEAADQFNDSINALTNSLTGVGISIANSALPYLNQMATAMADVARNGGGLLDLLGQLANEIERAFSFGTGRAGLLAELDEQQAKLAEAEEAIARYKRIRDGLEEESFGSSLRRTLTGQNITEQIEAWVEVAAKAKTRVGELKARLDGLGQTTGPRSVVQQIAAINEATKEAAASTVALQAEYKKLVEQIKEGRAESGRAKLKDVKDSSVLDINRLRDQARSALDRGGEEGAKEAERFLKQAKAINDYLLESGQISKTYYQAQADLLLQLAEDGQKVLDNKPLNLPVAPDLEQAVQAGMLASEAAQSGVKPIVIPGVVQIGSQFMDEAALPTTPDGRTIVSAAGLATGGEVRGPGTATSDSILARLSAGEFVVRAAAVKEYGVGLLDKLNRLALPKFTLPAFAHGGVVNNIVQHYALPTLSRLAAMPIPAYAAGGPVGTPVNLYLPDGRSFGMSAAPSVARELTKILSTEVLKRGRR
jgi:hypothetical protein